MDITKQFNDQIKRVNKLKHNTTTTNIFPSSTKSFQDRNVLFKASILILQNIDALKNMLNENRDAYIDTSKHHTNYSSMTATTPTKMTDHDRDEIDRMSLKQIDLCNTGISKMESMIIESYKRNINSHDHHQSPPPKLNSNRIKTMMDDDPIRDDPNDMFSRNVQQFDCNTRFYFNITDQLRYYLNQVSNQFKKQRQFRISMKMKEQERFQNSLDTLSSSSISSPSPLSSTTIIQQQSTINSPPSSISSPINNTNNNNNNNDLLKKQQQYLLEEQQEEKEIEFDEEERIIYEQQNEKLMSELETLPDQILLINQQIETLSQLFDDMTPHILEQREMIESIYETNIDATKYLTRGNDQIYIATKKSFDFRVMLLFFLIISSFSLLFLNWYQE